METTTDAAETSVREPSPIKPLKWWQWLLMYPTLVATVLAAIPTLIEAYNSTIKYKVPYGQSSAAKEQDVIWMKNIDCLKDAPYEPMVTSSNLQVDGTICKSGDVLIEIRSPDREGSIYHWVGVEAILNRTGTIDKLLGSRLSLTSEAHATNVDANAGADSDYTVLCQKYLQPGKVLRRISLPNKGCFDQTINTYTGAVESTTPATCSNKC